MNDVLLILRYAQEAMVVHLTHDRRFWIAHCIAAGWITEPVREDYGEHFHLTDSGRLLLKALDRS